MHPETSVTAIIEKYQIPDIDQYDGDCLHDKLLSYMAAERRNTPWKYLRETSKRSDYQSEWNTDMRTYLEMIFPGDEFVYDKSIPADIQRDHGATTVRRYRPDARCEKRKLIVEFDGLPHYQELHSIFNDRERDTWARDLGYKVVRIPYWLPLNVEDIDFLFGVHVPEGCPLKFGLFDNPNRDYGIGISPASFCEQGALRFAREFEQLPAVTQEMLLDDLALVTEANAYGIDALPSCISYLRYGDN
ncbi:hypothetical protein BTIS_0826 [Bifidobacterium tissieri]|uniref:DUF559 domain-containing protein n=1 Tax=Bifidobacterium tissieri TaxID=1630162 RepID=A0A261FH38_9BIFI|nr:DUF559 domain-containing protein [Bifidobacterium tissieri]OZG58457.1 hypothetical protein BTIS_0826 [Bifidobacterium tissieri]